MAQLVKALVAFMTIVILADVAVGINYTVGGPNGSWDLDTDYKAWAKSHVFRPGDFLIFKYDDTQHDVAEVGRRHFHACNGTQSYSYDMSGHTEFKLVKPGKRYFICTVPQHCTMGGMKLEINISRSEPPEMENVTMTDKTPPENPFPEKTCSKSPPASRNSTSSSTASSIPPSSSPIPHPSSSGHANDSKIAPPPPPGVHERTLDDDDGDNNDDSGNSPSSISERPPPPPPHYPPIGSPGYYARVIPPESDILFLLDDEKSAVSEIRVGTFASALVGLLMLVLVF